MRKQSHKVASKHYPRNRMHLYYNLPDSPRASWSSPCHLIFTFSLYGDFELDAQLALPLRLSHLPSSSAQEEISAKLFLWSLVSLGTKSIKIFLILTHAILNVWCTGRN